MHLIIYTNTLSFNYDYILFDYNAQVKVFHATFILTLKRKYFSSVSSDLTVSC